MIASAKDETNSAMERTRRGAALSLRPFLWAVAAGAMANWLTLLVWVLLKDGSADEVGAAIIAVMISPGLVGFNVAIGYALFFVVRPLAPRKRSNRIIFIFALSIFVTAVCVFANISLGRPHSYSPYFYAPPPPLAIDVVRSIRSMWPLYCWSALVGGLAYLGFERMGGRSAARKVVTLDELAGRERAL